MAKLIMKSVHGDVQSMTKNGVTLSVVPPLRAGHPWTVEEDEKLRWRFEKGVPMADLALVHQRTRGAIKAELKRLGLIPGTLKPRKVRQVAASG